jgi:hypothetical protein
MTETNAPPATKAELLERLRTGRATWDALVALVPDDVMDNPALSNGWSVKDLVAHVAAYEKWTAEQIAAEIESRAPSDEELLGAQSLPETDKDDPTDAINEMIYERFKDTDLATVRAFSTRAYQELVAAIDAASDEKLQESAPWTGGGSALAIIPGNSYDHYDEHTEELRTILGADTY